MVNHFNAKFLECEAELAFDFPFHTGNTVTFIVITFKDNSKEFNKIITVEGKK